MKCLPILRLMRLPTVFTALSNILCGYFVSRGVRVSDLTQSSELPLLLSASAGLYLGGMVLNDVCDSAIDSVERPERVIPSGQVSRRAALCLAMTLMSLGVLAAFAAGTPSFLISLILSVLIVAYNITLKHTAAGGIAMGGCRFFNLILGASAAPNLAEVFRLPQLGVAFALFVYITGVTLFARHETGEPGDAAGSVRLSSEKSRLLRTGVCVVLAGLLIDGVVGWYSEFPERPRIAMWLSLALIGGNILVRTEQAIRSGIPRVLQKTVGLMLLNVIFLDAAMVFGSTGDSRLASIVVMLVVPAMLLKRLIPMS